MDYPFFFTWTTRSAARPVELTGGDGARFTTADGGSNENALKIARLVTGRRKLSLHEEPRRSTCIFAPPLCITEDELVRGVRSFGDAAVAAFGAAP